MSTNNSSAKSSIVKAQLVFCAVTKVVSTRAKGRVIVDAKVLEATNELSRAEGEELVWHKSDKSAAFFADKAEMEAIQPGQLIQATACTADNYRTIVLKKGSIKLRERKAKQQPVQEKLF